MLGRALHSLEEQDGIARQFPSIHFVARVQTVDLTDQIMVDPPDLLCHCLSIYANASTTGNI